MAKTGRPTKYKNAYCKGIIKFFSGDPYKEVTTKFTNKKGEEWEKDELRANDIPFFSAYAHSIDVSHATLLAWCDKHPDFLEAYKRAKELQEYFLAINCLMGLYQQSFGIFTAKNILGWRDERHLDVKKKVDVSGKMGLDISAMKPKERKKMLDDLMKKRKEYAELDKGG